MVTLKNHQPVMNDTFTLDQNHKLNRVFSQLKFIANWKFAQVIVLNLKIPRPLLGFEPQPLGCETSALTIILTLQVILKGIKVCVQ